MKKEKLKVFYQHKYIFFGNNVTVFTKLCKFFIRHPVPERQGTNIYIHYHHLSAELL